MKTKAGAALVACALSVAGVALYAADANPIAGNWATDAVANVEMPEKQGMFGKLAAGAVNGGNTGGGIGNQSGTTQVGPISSGRTSGGGRTGGGGFGQGGPGGPGGGSRDGDRRRGPDDVQDGAAGDFAATASTGRVTRKIVEEEPAIMMELKVDAKGKLSGKVTVINVVPAPSLKEFKVEEGAVTDKKFEFKVNEKSEKVSNTTRWTGELVDEQTIKITRLTKGGQPMDTDAIVFHKAK